MNDAPLHLYVDGSCGDNRNVGRETIAGWGVCIVRGRLRNGQGPRRSDRGVQWTSHHRSRIPEYMGASVGSNNTAELTAIGHALRWALIDEREDALTIRSDSEYAANLTAGIWKPKANKELVRRIRSFWKECLLNRTVTIEHVRAHRGHRWNERADHLAFRAMEGRNPDPLQFWKPGNR